MEGDGLAHLLEQRVGLDVGVVVHRLVARRRHHESAHALLVAELLHGLVGRFRIVERQIEHRDQPRLDREDALAEPAIVALRHGDLDLGLRMQPEKQHRRREQARVVDAHRVHPQLGHADVAVDVRRHLLELAQLVPGDAAAEILVADLAVHHRGAAGPLARLDRGAADHRIVDVGEDLLVGLVLVVVRVDVDDQEILVVARPRLLGGVLEVLGDGELVEPELAHFRAWHVHGRSPICVAAATRCRQATT